MQPRQRRTGSIIPESAGQPINDSSEEEEELVEQPKTYAPLHDFCMTLPYGVLAVVVGVVGLLLGGGVFGWLTLGNGVAVLAMAALSLRAWRKGNLTKTFTILSMVFTFPVWWAFYQSLFMPLPAQTARVGWVGVMSLVLIFLFINILMGGNPPKGHEKLREKAA